MYRSMLLLVCAVLTLATNASADASTSSSGRPGSPDESVTEVTSAQELQEAMRSSARHIHITTHLDLTGLSLSERGTISKILFYAPANLSSLTVRSLARFRSAHGVRR